MKCSSNKVAVQALLDHICRKSQMYMCLENDTHGVVKSNSFKHILCIFPLYFRSRDHVNCVLFEDHIFTVDCAFSQFDVLTPYTDLNIRKWRHKNCTFTTRAFMYVKYSECFWDTYVPNLLIFMKHTRVRHFIGSCLVLKTDWCGIKHSDWFVYNINNVACEV